MSLQQSNEAGDNPEGSGFTHELSIHGFVPISLTTKKEFSRRIQGFPRIYVFLPQTPNLKKITKFNAYNKSAHFKERLQVWVEIQRVSVSFSKFNKVSRSCEEFQGIPRNSRRGGNSV